MASIRVVLWKYRKKKDGSCSLAVSITKDRKTQYVHTGEYVLENQWDENKQVVKKSHPNSMRLNAFLQKKINEAHSTLLESEVNEEDMTSKQIKKKVKRKLGTTSFFEVAIERIKRQRMEENYSVATADLSKLYNLNEYLTLNTGLSKEKAIEGIQTRRRERISKSRWGGQSFEEDYKFFSNKQSLSFSEIDMTFITKYKSFCKAYLQQSTRTITNQLIFIRTVYNQAIKEGLADRRKYPFGGENEKIRVRGGNKIGLTREEVQRIEQLDLEVNHTTWHTRNIFLFSFYLAGIRVSDVLEMKWSDFVDGRLYYQMNKNEKPVSLKVPEKAANILELYCADKASNQDYVFPFLKRANDDKKDLFTKARNASNLMNKHLKKIALMCDIDKSLSNHLSRHTFGNLAGDSIHPLMLQKLYRHTDLNTTLNYQANFIHKDADDALDSVLGL